MNLSDHTLKVAVLRVRSDRLKGQYEAARLEAEPAYADARRAGISQLKVPLPGGGEAGTLSIYAGGTDVTFDEAELVKVAEESTPGFVEDYLDPAALTDPRVIKLVKDEFPELGGRRVTKERRAELEEEVRETGGRLLNLSTGELVQVATLTPREPTGRFAYVPGKKGAAAIQALLDAGILTPDGTVAGAVPEPASPETDPVPEETAADDFGREGDPFFMDDHGFLDPVRAAVQGGFSTPPIEAYRMLRSGGVGAERAREWMTAHGLDPDDPRQGKDTPWPLATAGQDGAE